MDDELVVSGNPQRPAGLHFLQQEILCIMLTDPLFGTAVSAADLTGDDFSRQVLADFNSVDVLVDVSIDNTAWFPEMGYLAATTHDRLKNIMNSEGYNVVNTSSVLFLRCLSCATSLALPMTK